jgi:hypothetical protein
MVAVDQHKMVAVGPHKAVLKSQVLSAQVIGPNRAGANLVFGLCVPREPVPKKQCFILKIFQKNFVYHNVAKVMYHKLTTKSNYLHYQ